MVRVCFQLQLLPERREAYVERHRAVWPDMLSAIADSGRRDHFILVRADGLLIGHYETDDDAESARRLAADPRTAAWETESASFFADLGGRRPDTGATRLPEVVREVGADTEIMVGTGIMNGAGIVASIAHWRSCRIR